MSGVPIMCRDVAADAGRIIAGVSPGGMNRVAPRGWGVVMPSEPLEEPGVSQLLSLPPPPPPQSALLSLALPLVPTGVETCVDGAIATTVGGGKEPCAACGCPAADAVEGAQ